jgi:hypothetical protein
VTSAYELFSGVLANTGQPEAAEPMLATLRADSYGGPNGLTIEGLARGDIDIDDAIGSCSGFQGRGIFDGTERRLAGGVGVSGVGNAGLGDQAFQAGRCIEDQDLGRIRTERHEAVGMPGFEMQESAGHQDLGLAGHGKRQSAGQNIEGLGLAPVRVFGRAAADSNCRMGQGVTAACVGTADDHGLALTADPVGPAVGDIHESETGWFVGHAAD